MEKMFCYQCQETAKGTGCTVRGVCGKTSDVANLQDLLLFVLKGIAHYRVQLRALDAVDQATFRGKNQRGHQITRTVKTNFP